MLPVNCRSVTPTRSWDFSAAKRSWSQPAMWAGYPAILKRQTSRKISRATLTEICWSIKLPRKQQQWSCAGSMRAGQPDKPPDTRRDIRRVLFIKGVQSFVRAITNEAKRKFRPAFAQLRYKIHFVQFRFAFGLVWKNWYFTVFSVILSENPLVSRSKTEKNTRSLRFRSAYWIAQFRSARQICTFRSFRSKILSDCTPLLFIL